MNRIATILAVFAFSTSMAVAGELKAPAHGEKLIGHDGKQWVMEGCAAYPVTAETATKQSRPVVVRDSWTRPEKKLAQSQPVTPAKTATE